MVAFSTTDKSANVTLSASFGTANLVATMTSAVQGGVRADTSVTAKTYIEFWMSGGSGWIVGFANSTLPLGTQLGTTKDGFCVTSGSQIRVNNGNVANTQIVPFLGGAVRLAWDPVNKLIWIAVNNSFWNNSPTADPASGVGGINLTTNLNAGPWFPMFSSATNTDAVIARFGGGDMAYPIPSGFATMDTNVQAFSAAPKFTSMVLMNTPQSAASAFKFISFGILNTPQKSVNAFKFVSYAILIRPAAAGRAFRGSRPVFDMLMEEPDFKQPSFRSFAPPPVSGVVIYTDPRIERAVRDMLFAEDDFKQPSFRRYAPLLRRNRPWLFTVT
jgi:hypothetical protein